MKPLNVTVVNPPGLTRPAVTLGQGPRVDIMDMATQAQLLEPGKAARREAWRPLCEHVVDGGTAIWSFADVCGG